MSMDEIDWGTLLFYFFDHQPVGVYRNRNLTVQQTIYNYLNRKNENTFVKAQARSENVRGVRLGTVKRPQEFKTHVYPGRSNRIKLTSDNDAELVNTWLERIDSIHIIRVTDTFYIDFRGL